MYMFKLKVKQKGAFVHFDYQLNLRHAIQRYFRGGLLRAGAAAARVSIWLLLPDPSKNQTWEVVDAATNILLIRFRLFCT